MITESIKVRMLGAFSIEANGRSIHDTSNRSRKLWLLLAYLIYNRKTFTPQANLIRILWDDEEKTTNPLNALKTTLHRARGILNELGEAVGYDLLLSREGSYCWNNAFPIVVDVEEFDSVYKDGLAEGNAEKKLALYFRAIDLYQGDFLEKLSGEAWVYPIHTYYHRIYLELALDTLSLLMEKERYGEIISLCQRVLAVERYHEGVYRYLMQAMSATGNQRGVIAAYRHLREQLFSTFGVVPAEDIQKLYYDALNADNANRLSAAALTEQLQEEPPERGALLCSYEIFKYLYHAQARMLSRKGEAIHLALLSAESRSGKALGKRSLQLAMDNLQNTIRLNLRLGDTVAKCSASQFVMMLPQASYDNSIRVCQRIRQRYFREYPHSPIQLSFTVQPLRPPDSKGQC